MTEATETIKTIRPEWTKVIEEMVQVKVHVTRWRAATRSDFSEYGLDEDSFRAYTAGTRHLLPRDIQKELGMLERLARAAQDRFSYKVPLFGHLMPKSRYLEFKEWVEEKPLADLRRYLHKKESKAAWQDRSLKQRYFDLAEEIASKRDQIVDQVVETYRPSAIVRWRLENGLAKDADVVPPDEWMDETLEVMVRRIPQADEIRASFTLEIEPAFIEAPDAAVKAAKMDEIQRKEAEVERRLEEISWAKVRAEKDKVAAESRTAREKERLALLAEQEELERERKITQEIMAIEKQKKAERIDQTLDAVAGQLHSLVYEAVCDGLAQIRDKGKLHPRSVGRLKDVVEQVRLLNFTDDRQLNRVCAELERMTNEAPATEANADRVRDLLKDVGVSLKADMVLANVESRSARDLGIPDEPAPEMVREARSAGGDLFSAADDITLERGERSERPDLQIA